MAIIIAILAFTIPLLLPFMASIIGIMAIIIAIIYGQYGHYHCHYGQ